MKITPTLLREVQRDIDEHGLGVAVHNLLWRHAAEQMTDLGHDRVRTSDKPARQKVQ